MVPASEVRVLIAVVVVLSVVALALFAAAVVGWGSYLRMQNMIEQDCTVGGSVAALGVEHQVNMCREVAVPDK